MSIHSSLDSIVFIQDIDQTIAVIRNAGQWLQDSGKNPSQWWQLQNLTREFLLKRAEPDEFYLGLVNDKPAVAAILQDNERNQSWKYIDKNKPQKALYIHWLCVHRDFAGMGLPKKMIVFANHFARQKNLPLLRLDANADESKLCKIYEDLGFKQVGIEDGSDYHTAFYQKNVTN